MLSTAASGTRVLIAAFAMAAVVVPVGVVLSSDIELQLAIVGGVAAVLGLLVFGIRSMAVLLLCVAFALGPSNSLRVLPFMTYGDAALCAAIVLGLVSSAWLGHRVWLPLPYVLGAIALVASGLIASALAADVNSLGNLALLVFAAIGLPILGAVWRPSLSQVQLLAWSYLAGELISIGYALVTPVNAATGRALGLSLKSNHFGLAAALGAALALYLYMATSGWKRWVAVGTGSLCLVGVFVSGSRAALIAVLAVVVAFAVAIKAWRTSTLVGFLGLGALVAQDLVLSLLPPGSALYRLVLGDASSQQSDANRVDVLYTTFNSFLEKPFFGRGFANSLEAHNIYLQVATAAGLFGLLGFALILFTAIRPIFMPQLGSLRWLALPPVAYLVAGLVANTLWDRFVWVLVGLAVLSLPRPGGRPGVDPSAALPEPAAATARS